MNTGTETISASVLDSLISVQRRELWARAWKRFVSRPMSVVGLGIIIVVVVSAILAPYLAPYPQHAGKFTDFANALQGPSLTHPLGPTTSGGTSSRESCSATGSR